MPSLSIDSRTSVECDRLPDQCPLCHSKVHPTSKFAHLVGETEVYSSRASVEAVFLCPNGLCQSLFIGYYRETDGINRSGSGRFKLVGAAPRTKSKPSFFDGIVRLSPSFVEIYSQASVAEAEKLDQVAGVGYRKSLEFLIKDYCCSRMQGEAETIKATPLGACIDRYVDEQHIKDCAKLATWLGNDETHYVRKWEDKDINDLKALISLTTSWIEMKIKTEEYRKAMLQA